MGGDGQYLDGWHRIRSTNPKVFRLGDMLIGSQGDQRVSDIIQYNLEAPNDFGIPSPEEYLCIHLIPKIRSLLKEHGAMMSEDGMDKMDAAIMIGHKSRLFVIGEDFTLSQIASDYEAVGAGARYALGYMYAMQATSLTPERLIEKALECAAHFSAAVSEPFEVLEL